MANLFKIPRTKFARTDARWALVRKHGTSRRAMVDFICDIGGYYNRGDRFAIEFDISAYTADLDADHLWAVMIDQGIADLSRMPPMEQVLARRLFDEEHERMGNDLWTTAVEDAYRGWADSDMPYETFAGIRVDWFWGIYGRGGKHLCMTECEGINLARNEEDLREALMEREENPDGTRAVSYVYDIERVKKLFLICVQNSVEITPEAVGREVEHCAAFRLWSTVEMDLDEAVEAYNERNELRASADLIRGYLNGSQPIPDGGDALAVTALDNILKLADISSE